MTYKQLLQHWLAKASEILDENERIQAVDSIPTSIRRANPNMTRDYYLGNRSQPAFLNNVAYVSSAAGQDLGHDELSDFAKLLGVKPASSKAVLTMHHRYPAGASSPRWVSLQRRCIIISAYAFFNVGFTFRRGRSKSPRPCGDDVATRLLIIHGADAGEGDQEELYHSALSPDAEEMPTKESEGDHKGKVILPPALLPKV